jgi:prophage antirepressor-like protein
MSQLSVHYFETVAVRLLGRDGEPWFVLADVCRALGYSDSAQAARNLEDDEIHTLHNTQGITASRNGIVKLVNESGLYSLILTSRKPEAKRFKRWVTHDVLPAIRRAGRYEAMSPPSPVPATADAGLMTLGEGEREARLLALAESRHKLDMVREARCSFGPKASRQAWRNLGFLPLEFDETAGPLARAEAMAARVESGAATIAELAAGEGVTERKIQYMLKIARNLSPEGKAMLAGGELSITMARHLAVVSPEDQAPLIEMIKSGDISSEEEVILAVRAVRTEGDC